MLFVVSQVLTSIIKLSHISMILLNSILIKIHYVCINEINIFYKVVLTSKVENDIT